MVLIVFGPRLMQVSCGSAIMPLLTDHAAVPWSVPFDLCDHPLWRICWKCWNTYSMLYFWV